MTQRQVTTKGRRHPSLVFLPFVLPFVILAATAVYGAVAPSTLPAPGGQGRLVWGPGIFTSRSEFKTLLVAHGGNYKHWAKLHPAALRLLPRKPLLSALPATQTNATKRATPPTTNPVHVPAHEVAAAASAHPTNTAVSLTIWAMIAVGVLFGAGAVAPERAFRRLGVGGRIRPHDARIVSAAAGVALLVGVVVATQLA
jgi:hypothetical protein